MRTTRDGGESHGRDCPPPVCEVPFEDEPPGMRVVEAVATASDVGPMQVTPRLSDVVDPDALDQLFSSMHGGQDRSDGCVKFEMGPYLVQIDWGENSIRIFDTTPA